MHPSDMAKKEWCGRHDYYRIIDTPIEKTSKANPSFRMENISQRATTSTASTSSGCGRWASSSVTSQCKDCGHRWGDTSPEKCQFCLSDRLMYKEYPLRRKTLLIEGHADAATTLGCLVEIKSIGIRTLAFDAPRLYQRYLDGESAEDIWFEISRPFPPHASGPVVPVDGLACCTSRSCSSTSPSSDQQIKEFVVEYNKSFIAPLLETAKDVTTGVQAAGLPPPRPSWAEGPEGKDLCFV